MRTEGSDHGATSFLSYVFFFIRSQNIMPYEFSILLLLFQTTWNECFTITVIFLKFSITFSNSMSCLH